MLSQEDRQKIIDLFDITCQYTLLGGLIEDPVLMPEGVFDGEIFQLGGKRPVGRAFLPRQQALIDFLKQTGGDQLVSEIEAPEGYISIQLRVDALSDPEHVHDLLMAFVDQKLGESAAAQLIKEGLNAAAN